MADDKTSRLTQTILPIPPHKVNTLSASTNVSNQLQTFQAPINYKLEMLSKKIKQQNETTLTLPANKSGSLTLLFKKDFDKIPFIIAHLVCGDKMGNLEMIIESITQKDFTVTLINGCDSERVITIYWKAKN